MQCSAVIVIHVSYCVKCYMSLLTIDCRVTACLENVEMSGILTAVSDFTKSHGNDGEKLFSVKSGQQLFIVSCIFASVRVFSSIQLVLV